METTYKLNAQDLTPSFVASIQSVYLDRDIEITVREVERHDECPICAQHRDPETGELRFNAETMAGMQEVEDMISGKIPVKWHTSLDGLLADLDSD